MIYHNDLRGSNDTGQYNDRADLDQQENFKPQSYTNPFRAHSNSRRQPFTIIDNALCRNSSLTFEARGFLVYLLSHREDFHINIAYLVHIHKGVMGRDKIIRILKELIQAGYVRRVQPRNANNNQFLKMFYEFSHEPIFTTDQPASEENSETTNQELKKCLPQTGKPFAGKATPAYIRNNKNTNIRRNIYDLDETALESSADPLDRLIYIFLNKMRKLRPKLPGPKATELPKWKSDLQAMLDEGLSEKAIEEALDYVIYHDENQPVTSKYRLNFTITSPEKLRMKLEEIQQKRRIRSDSKSKTEIIDEENERAQATRAYVNTTLNKTKFRENVLVHFVHESVSFTDEDAQIEQKAYFKDFEAKKKFDRLVEEYKIN